MTNSIPASFFDDLQSLLQGPGNVDRSGTNARYIQGLSINDDAVTLYDPADGGGVFDISAVPKLVSRHARTVRCDHSHCGRSFTERKSLYRHKRTVHKIRNFQCFHCEHSFKRQDILARHLQTIHEAGHVKVHCFFCKEQCRPRSLETHLKSKRCEPTCLYATWKQHAFAQMPAIVGGQRTTHMQLLPHLAEPRDPIMLGVSLFVKFEPWGEDHRWLKNHITPDPNTYLPPEVRKLSSLLDRQLAETQPLSHIDQDSPLPDVLAILCVFVGQTQGWDPAMRYCKPLVMVAIKYIVNFGPEPTEFFKPSSVAVEVFTTILLRNMPAETAATCKEFMVDMLKLLRRAAITTAWLAFGHPDAPIVESAEEWHYRWQPELNRIANKARMVPKSTQSRAETR